MANKKNPFSRQVKQGIKKAECKRLGSQTG